MRNRDFPPEICLFIQSTGWLYRHHRFWIWGQAPWNRIKSSSDDSVAVSESLDEFKEKISELMLLPTGS
jgi:hypothetical protein